jgi:membrane associated rhomboid family serine protease
LTRAALGRRGSAALLVGVALAVTLVTAGPGVAVVAHFTGFALGAVAGRFRILGAANPPDRPGRA